MFRRFSVFSVDLVTVSLPHLMHNPDNFFPTESETLLIFNLTVEWWSQVRKFSSCHEIQTHNLSVIGRSLSSPMFMLIHNVFEKIEKQSMIKRKIYLFNRKNFFRHGYFQIIENILISIVYLHM